MIKSQWKHNCPATLEVVKRLNSRYFEKESIWAIGGGQGVVYVYSNQELTENLQSIMLADAFPIFVNFIVIEQPVFDLTKLSNSF